MRKMHRVRHSAKRSRNSWICLAIALSIIITACGGSAPESTAVTETDAPTIEPTPTSIPPTPKPSINIEDIYDELWVLLGFGDAADPTVVQRDTVITIVFSPDGTFSGSGGCNNYTGNFEASADGSLSISSPLASTMVYCSQGMEQEQEYLTSFQSAQSFAITPEGRLEITYDAGQPFDQKLVYAQGETPLVETQWTLISYGSPGNPTPVEAGTTITAVFSEDGKISGTAGCNFYAGTFEVSGDQISISPLATSRMTCPVGDLQEQVYLEALGTAQTLQLAGQSLYISFDDGQGVLHYTSAGLPLEGTLWSLASVEGEPIPEEISITAMFEAGDESNQNTVAGSSGCNSYLATYEVDGERLVIGAPASTLIACETGMEAESVYLIAIEGENTFNIIADTLEIQTDDGTLTYVADRTPLLGALWVLVALGDAEEPLPPVEGSNFTAQFSRNPGAPSGVVAGTTGCNEYSAAYTASLDEIKINLPEMTGNENCAPGLFEQEQQYFLGMNAARSYHIVGNTLYIPYDEGRQLLVFAADQTQIAGKRPLSELDGTLWYLHFINESSIIPGTIITAQFRVASEGEAGTISGDSGCNTYNATFAQELGVNASLSSTVICFMPEGVKEQENNYLSALSRAYGYWLTGNQLVINTGLGALTYRQNTPDSSRDQTHLLQNVKWFLVSYNTQPSVTGYVEPFLFFNLDLTFLGNTGCNEINGQYETNFEQIDISSFSVGDNPCPDETSAEQESVILTNLNNSQTFVVANTGMQIASDPGVLNFSSEPLQRPDPVEPPTSVINATSEASVGEIIRFDGSNSASEVGISNYDWNLGDGNQKSDKIVEHIYVAPGTYEVLLTVTDKVGQRSSATHTIDIIAQPPEQIPPTAVIAGPTDGFVAEPVTFSVSGSVSGSSPITSFTWDFDDGTTVPASPNTEITTLYEKPGIYTVTVTATDANGLSDSASMEVEIDTRMEGPVWTLHPVLPRTSITMQFLEGRLTGFSGCNTYDGIYTATDTGGGAYLVTLSELTSTRLSCAEELMQQESEYLEALASISAASTAGNLLLLSGSGPDLTFYEVGTPIPELFE